MGTLRVLTAILLLSFPAVILGFAQETPSATAKALVPGQVSGRILRADTAEPLADVIVTLSPADGTQGTDVSQRTKADGGYGFSDLGSGTYLLVANRAGFVGQYYGQKDEQGLQCPPSCISLGPGQKLDGIDIHLAASPPISQMKDDALAAAYPDKRPHLNFGPTRFSPDGRKFAFAVGGVTGTIGASERVWVYDLKSRDLTRLGEILEENTRRTTVSSLAWGEDGSLYVSALTHRGPVEPLFFVMTPSGTKVISRREVPAQISATFQQDEQRFNGFAHEERNKEFVVTSNRLCHGCPDTLSVERSDGTGSYDIAKIDRNFIFDPGRALVFYPKLGPIITGSTVIFDLHMRRSREIPIPIVAESFLDQISDGTGHLLAYVAIGLCEVDASSEEEANRLFLNVSLRRETSTRRVCFVKLP